MKGKNSVVENKVRSKKPIRSENEVELALWLKYKNEAGKLSCHEALTELLDRHDGLLRRLAANMAIKNCRSGTFDDHLQNLRIGAMKGYASYNPDGGAALNTWTVIKAKGYAIDEAYKNNGEIKISKSTRNEYKALNSYFSGDLDPGEKEKFELDNKLQTPEKVAIALEKWRLLNATFCPLENTYEDNHEERFQDHRCLTEDEIISKIDFEHAKLQLSERANAVLKMRLEGESNLDEVAEALKITTGKVRLDIKKALEILPKSLQDHSHMV